jgi:hypothetical protein
VTSRFWIAFLLSLGHSPTATAQTDSLSHSRFLSAGAFVLGTTMSIYTHELGHLAFAYGTGARSAHINLWPPEMIATFPQRPSKLDQTIIWMAGPLSTRFLSEGVDGFLNRVSTPDWLTTIGGAWYFAMRVDLPYQVLTSSISHLKGVDQKDDIYKGIMEPWIPNRGSRNIAYVILLISQAVDFYLDLDEILRNLHRIRGQPSVRQIQLAGTFDLFSYDPERGIMISYTVRF